MDRARCNTKTPICMRELLTDCDSSELNFYNVKSVNIFTCATKGRQYTRPDARVY